MNDLIPFNNSTGSSSRKELSNWEKPGGKLGMVIAGLLGAAGLIVLYKILPFLIALATNIITLGILCAVIAGVLFLISNKEFRRNVSLGYFIIMRKITGLIIEIDPIAIVKRRVIMLKKKMNDIQTLLGKLNGSIKEICRKIDERTKEYNTAINQYKIYKEQGKENEKAAQVVGNRITSLNDLLLTYKANKEQSEKWYEILKKMYEMADLTVQDTEFQVEIRTEQFEQIKKQHNAFKGIMSIIKGDPDEVALFTDAMDYMARDISDKLGEMEFIIDSAGGLMDTYDMNKMLSSKQANEIIAKYDEYGIDGMFQSFGDNKAALPSPAKALVSNLATAKNDKEIEVLMANYSEASQPKQLKSRFFEGN